MDNEGRYQDRSSYVTVYNPMNDGYARLATMRILLSNCDATASAHRTLGAAQK
jgi:hypothetical protein